MVRVRFEIPFYVTKDYRPAIWILKNPYWLCGHTQYANVLVAYADDMEQFMEQWPNAHILKVDEKEKLEFSTRFPRPVWYRKVDMRFRNGKIFQVNGRDYDPDKKKVLEIRKKIVENGIDL